MFPLPTKAAFIRALRTAAQTFGGVIGTYWLANLPTISGLITALRAHSDRAGGAALLAALIALGWNQFGPVTPEIPKS